MEAPPVVLKEGWAVADVRGKTNAHSEEETHWTVSAQHSESVRSSSKNSQVTSYRSLSPGLAQDHGVSVGISRSLSPGKLPRHSHLTNPQEAQGAQQHRLKNCSSSTGIC
jgi:hypothetical protein